MIRSALEKEECSSQNSERSSTDQSPSHDHAKHELTVAAQARNKTLVRELFETTPLDADDATEYLEWASSDLTLLRSLRGADLNSHRMESACRRGSLDVLKLSA
jgi:hypothetical protein